MLLLSATLYGDVCIVLLAASDGDLPLMMIDLPDVDAPCSCSLPLFMVKAAIFCRTLYGQGRHILQV